MLSVYMRRGSRASVEGVLERHADGGSDTPPLPAHRRAALCRRAGHRGLVAAHGRGRLARWLPHPSSSAGGLGVCAAGGGGAGAEAIQRRLRDLRRITGGA